MTVADRAGRERWYDDACGTAFALELIGERWSLLIVRELMFGPRRFSELRGGLPGISANILTLRLASLEAAGLLVRRTLPPPGNAQVYELTRWGYEAEEPIQVLGRWAVRSPDHDPTLPLSPASLMMSLRTMVPRDLDPVLALAIRFRIGREDFLVRIAGGTLRVTREEGPADAVLTGDTGTLAALIYLDLPLDAAIAEGKVRFEGDRDTANRFFAFFALPDKWTDTPA